MIHDAIAKEAETDLPYFEKAFVWIEITAPRGAKNSKVWDTSNRAINVIINNLKNIFFWDDNFEHMAFGAEAAWGEPSETRVYIMNAVEFLTSEKQKSMTFRKKSWRSLFRTFLPATSD